MFCACFGICGQPLHEAATPALAVTAAAESITNCAAWHIHTDSAGRGRLGPQGLCGSQLWQLATDLAASVVRKLVCFTPAVLLRSD